MSRLTADNIETYMPVVQEVVRSLGVDAVTSDAIENYASGIIGAVAESETSREGCRRNGLCQQDSVKVPLKISVYFRSFLIQDSFIVNVHVGRRAFFKRLKHHIP